MKKLIIITAFLLAWGVAWADVTVYIPQATNVKEAEDRVTVNLPFDSEYQIALDNRDQARRALVKIRIDGRNVTRDGLILRAGESVKLDRFLDTGTLDKGRKFKFVPQEGELQFKDDGMMFIQVQYERAKEPIIRYQQPKGSMLYEPVPFPNWGWSITPTSGSIATFTSFSDTSPGITIEGGESRQRFREEKFGEPEGDEQGIIISMEGFWKGRPLLLNR